MIESGFLAARVTWYISVFPLGQQEGAEANKLGLLLVSFAFRTYKLRYDPSSISI